MIDDCLNPDGKTYNGVKIMAKLSGLSEAEIWWTWCRAKELKEMGMDKEQILSVLKAEGRNNPWEGEDERNT
jgi:hypothetical protein